MLVISIENVPDKVSSCPLLPVVGCVESKLKLQLQL
jgi:hypothetical protein